MTLPKFVTIGLGFKCSLIQSILTENQLKFQPNCFSFCRKDKLKINIDLTLKAKLQHLLIFLSSIVKSTNNESFS